MKQALQFLFNSHKILTSFLEFIAYAVKTCAIIAFVSSFNHDYLTAKEFAFTLAFALFIFIIGVIISKIEIWLEDKSDIKCSHYDGKILFAVGILLLIGGVGIGALKGTAYESLESYATSFIIAAFYLIYASYKRSHYYENPKHFSHNTLTTLLECIAYTLMTVTAGLLAPIVLSGDPKMILQGLVIDVVFFFIGYFILKFELYLESKRVDDFAHYDTPVLFGISAVLLLISLPLIVFTSHESNDSDIANYTNTANYTGLSLGIAAICLFCAAYHRKLYYKIRLINKLKKNKEMEQTTQTDL